MADPMTTRCDAEAVLRRIVDEFAWMSEIALERIAGGGASSYIGPNLASAIIEARRLGSDRSNAAIVDNHDARAV